MNAGSANEPSTDPSNAADQMRAATKRLRDRAWMVTPMSSAASEPGECTEVDEAV